MKKIITLLISAFILSACGDHNLNTISVAKLTDRENAILSISSEQSFVYDFKTDKHKEVTVWIEKYESGNLVEDHIGELTARLVGDGSIIFTSSITNASQQQPTFNIAISGKKGVSSISALDSNAKDLHEMPSVWEPSQEKIF